MSESPLCLERVQVFDRRVGKADIGFTVRVRDGLAVSKDVFDSSRQCAGVCRRFLRLEEATQTLVVIALRNLDVEQQHARRLVNDPPVQIRSADVEDAHARCRVELTQQSFHPPSPKPLRPLPEPISNALAHHGNPWIARRDAEAQRATRGEVFGSDDLPTSSTSTHRIGRS